MSSSLESLSDYLKNSRSQLTNLFLAAQIQKEVSVLTQDRITVIVRSKSVVIECRSASQITRLKTRQADVLEIVKKITGRDYLLRFRVKATDDNG